MLSLIMLSAIMLSAIMLSIIMLSVVMLDVVGPKIDSMFLPFRLEPPRRGCWSTVFDNFRRLLSPSRSFFEIR